MLDINIELNDVNEQGGVALEALGKSIQQVGSAITTLVNTYSVSTAMSTMNNVMNVSSSERQKGVTELRRYFTMLNELQEQVEKQIKCLNLLSSLQKERARKGDIQVLEDYLEQLIEYRNKGLRLGFQDLQDDLADYYEMENSESISRIFNPYMWVALSAGGMSLSAVNYIYPSSLTSVTESASSVLRHMANVVNSGLLFWQALPAATSDINNKKGSSEESIGRSERNI